MTSFSFNGYEIALLVVLVYGLAVYGLYRVGWIGKDRTIALFGPALMIKTRRGRAFIDWVGRSRRFWTVASTIGVILAAIAMVGMVILLLIDAILAFHETAAQAPSVQEALGIPGINPIIPLGYGIVALIIAVVLHELFHGFVARSQKITVKSLGILWCVIPIGAFVEPEEAEMVAAPRIRRDRVAAAGVLANFILAGVLFVVVSAIVAGSVVPNANGVGVVQIFPNSPAQNASLSAGDIITELNGTTITTNAQLSSALSTAHPGQTVPLQYYSSGLGTTVTTNVTLAPLSAFTNQSSDAQTAFLGVYISFLTPAQLQGTLVWPPGTPYGGYQGTVNWLVLPIAGLEPISGSTQSFFHVTGPLAAFGPSSFWIGLNILYWVAWMSLLLGASNALPLIPLDGGLLVRDFMAAFASRVKKAWTPERAERFGGTAAIISTFVVLILLAWQFVIPRL
ncbi:MAG TPA: site-2 protease family protein [Thermoplasmata archaeon]|nr:site-2 protease family protein [Thermoplasmata archaeon]